MRRLHHRYSGFWLIVLLALAAIVGGGLTTASAWSQGLEYQVKAAFLFNFARFVSWPDSTFSNLEEPLCIGILGENPFGTNLSEIVAGKTVHGRKVRVRKLESPNDIEQCHVLFVSESEEDHLDVILETLKGLPVLSVSEMSGFAERGGIINFIVVDNKIRFQVNIDASERSALSVNSKLLSLAVIVKESDG